VKIGKDKRKKNQTGGVVKLVAAWRKIASGFGAMVATGRALGGGYRVRHGRHSRLPQ
jgi:hypothetical protein